MYVHYLCFPSLCSYSQQGMQNPAQTTVTGQMSLANFYLSPGCTFHRDARVFGLNRHGHRHRLMSILKPKKFEYRPLAASFPPCVTAFLKHSTSWFTTHDAFQSSSSLSSQSIRLPQLTTYIFQGKTLTERGCAPYWTGDCTANLCFCDANSRVGHNHSNNFLQAHSMSKFVISARRCTHQSNRMTWYEHLSFL